MFARISVYYCCSSTKGLPWRQVHEAIVTAKLAAKESWSTLTNEAFSKFLDWRFPADPPGKAECSVPR